MEEEPRVRFRNILVCYDGYRQIGWRTEEEFQELVGKNSVNWYAVETREGMSYFNVDNLPKEKTDYSLDA